MSESLVDLLAGLRGRGDHPLLICDDTRVSYTEAEARSARLARGLAALGAGKGTHVGLLYPNGVEFVVAMLAAARIGAVVVPFSTFLTSTELRTQVLDSDVAIMLSARSFRNHDYGERLAEVGYAPCLRHVLFEQPEAHEPDIAGLEADVDGCDPLAVIYTSGSTGAPKGVVHSHNGLLAHQRNLNAIRGFSAPDRLFCNSPFFWVGGFAFGLLATMVAGATLICSNATDAGATLDLLESEKPTLTNGFAAGIAHLTRHPSFAHRDLSSMRRGNLYPIMAPDARPADPELRHNMLGMTEAGSVVLVDADDSDQPEHRRGSYGRPAPGFETKVLASGELCIRGPYVMLGYYGRNREDCFDADGWFHTGDLVRVDDDGFYYFLGRAGAMIKTAGANVPPAEVERALANLLHCSAVHVVGLPDAERGQVVAAVMVMEDPSTFDEAAIRTALRDELSAYKVPRRFAVIRPAQLPVLSSGKVDMARLAGLFDG
ncbi:acyl--CoA ligase [Mycolicibacterium wolinskyi]|uniref:AMP-binding protein n=1 Tax=Mycolicibacterium wolinskyi TaxID=59750 RepID=A0A1X2F8E0_9MYCO|nr:MULTISPECIES: class I adenylate-forming enzyme family protein [Mycolicibacterium]MCV7286603.1 acyl--CoA ligase [Mycolicibacterium wolinskyi]MCV7293583.1 acyl--CoA ligase [Mycolicibacterium goodii]ORX14685.1 AMP-binding protein [Mycolicibacterium wolinskyi]